MSTVTPKLTHENLDSYKIIVKGEGKKIKYKDKVTGNSGTNTLYDLGMSKNDVDSYLLFRGGDMTQASEEDPYKSCLRAYVVKNKEKWYEQKDKNGNPVYDNDGKPKLVNFNAPYTLMISERDLGKDPEFDAFTKFTQGVKRKILKGFMENPSAYNSTYKNKYKTLEMLSDFGCPFEYCRHPKIKDGDGNPSDEPNFNKPKYAAFNFYENTSIAYPVEKTDEKGNVMHDKNGEALVTRQEIPKKKLLNTGVVIYGWPVVKTNKIGKGSKGLYLKSYLDSFVVFDLKIEKRENDHSDMLKSGYKSKIVNPNIAKAILGIKIDFGDPKLKPESTKSEVTKPEVKSDQESKGPNKEGTLTVNTGPVVIPKTSPKVNLKVLEGLTEHD